MLKNKKIMLLMFTLLMGALMILMPTKVNAANSEDIFTIETSINDWTEDKYLKYVGDLTTETDYYEKKYF